MSFLSWLIRRWWFWLVMGLLLLLAVLAALALSLRAAGRAAWMREQAAARAAGLPVSLADLVAAAPTVDADRQERLKGWCDAVSGQGWFGYPILADQALALAWHGRSPLRDSAIDETDPTQTERDLAVKTGEMQRLSTLLDEGPVLWGTCGWLRQRFPRPDEATVAQVITNHHPAHTALLAAIDAYLDAALSAHDRRALTHLDQLLAATRAMGCTDDLFQYLALSRCRDLAYLLVVADGTLGPTETAAWLAEPSEAAGLGALAMQGDRVINFTILAEHPDERFLFPGGTTPLGRMLIPTMNAVFLPQQLANASYRNRAWAEHLQGRRAPSGTWPRPDPAWLPATEHLRLMESFWFHDECLVALNRHRMVRAAARALLAWRAGALPADQLAAEALLGVHLHADPQLLPPLVYERLSSTRFRIGIDGRTLAGRGVPSLVPGLSFPSGPWRIDRCRIGQPPAAESAAEASAQLELDCTGRVPYGGASATTAAPAADALVQPANRSGP